MKNRAFTLIELIIVIAIIALLTGIIVTAINPAKSKSRDAKRISDMGNLQLTLELFFDRCKAYPTTLALTDDAAGQCPGDVELRTYISTIPTYPAGPDITQTKYQYSVTADRRDYALHAELENLNPVVKDGLPSSFNQGGIWEGDTFNCDNSDASKNYCIGPK